MSTIKKTGIAGSIIALLLIGGVLFVTLGGQDPQAVEDHSGHDVSTAQEPAAKGGLAAADRDGNGIVYQSGMHPWIVEDEPGQCPICGMDLVPVNVNEVEEGVVKIDAMTIQNSGVRTAHVTVEPLRRIVRTTGRFEVDEQRSVVVSPKISGWIEKLHVNYEGARVRKGQPLFEIYSPELVSTQEEYLLAIRTADRLGNTPDAQRLVDASRRRLAFWDISDNQIESLEKNGTPQKTLTLYAPASGTVVSTSVVEGQKITAGQTLMRLSDLSQVWLMADVYEKDLSWVGVGTTAQVALPYDSETKIVGRVDYIYDELDRATRTLKARVRVPNQGLKLKPGMYATVQLLGGETAPRPVVPLEAVVNTGDRSVVILALGEGRFMPTDVRTGVESDGRVQILQGLLGNEQVVTSAQFLIDSEARLSSAVGAMLAGHNHGDTPAPAEAAQPKSATPSPAQQPRSSPAADEMSHEPVHASGEIRGSIQHVRITIGSSGFEPARVHLQKGIATQLTFVRETERTCATEVQIPDFDIPPTDLPMHEPVTITLTPDRDGKFRFACAMDMIKGSLIVAKS